MAYYLRQDKNPVWILFLINSGNRFLQSFPWKPKKAKAFITKGFRFIESARRDSNHTAISPSGQNEKCLQLSTTFWRTQKTGIPYKSRKFQPLKKARDGIRTLPMSGKLIKSRRNAHCLKCVYRLSTTCKSEWKAVKGSAEQIHFTPLLLVVAVEITHYQKGLDQSSIL